MGKEQTNRDVLARIKLKVENPLKNLSEGHQKDFLQDTTAAFLKDVCKTRGIRGYSGKNKSFLSDLIVANLPKNELEELLNILSETVKRIKNYKKHWQEQFIRQANIITRSDEILQSEPDNISALEDKSYALNRLGEVEESLRIYDVILSIDSNYSYIMGKKAELLAEQGRFEEAVYWYEKALEIPNLDGIQGDYIAQKGKILVTMGKIDEAIELIKKALDGDRTGTAHLDFINEHSWEDIEDLYITLVGLQYKDEDEDAILITYTNWGDHLKAVYNYYPPDVFLEKAKLLEKKGDYEEAQRTLDVVIKEVQEEVKFDRPFHNSEYFLLRCKYWRKALFHKARISALQDDKANLMKNLDRAVIITLDTDKWAEEHTYRTPSFITELKEDVMLSPEFDGYRDAHDFYFIVNPEEKIINFYKGKNLTPEALTETQKELIEYLCKHVGSDIYLNFELYLNSGLRHKSNAFMIVLNNNPNNYSFMNIKYPYEKSLAEMKASKKLVLKSDSCQIDGTVYNKEFFEIALKIMGIENDLQDQILVSTKLNYPLRLRSGNKYTIFIAPIIPEEDNQKGIDEK